MADVHQRRRKLTTYGSKSAHRRHSEIDDIFSSPRPTATTRPSPPSPPSSTVKKPSSTSGGAASQIFSKTIASPIPTSTRNKQPSSPSVPERRRPTTSGSSKSNSGVAKEPQRGGSQSDRDHNSAAEQLQKEARLAQKTSEKGIYDIPTSDEDEDRPPPPPPPKASLKRKRASQTAKPKAASSTTGTVAAKIALDKPKKSVEARKERTADMPPTEKRSRGASAAPAVKRTSVEPSTTPSKISSGARITKPAERIVKAKNVQGSKKSIDKHVPVKAPVQPVSKAAENSPPRSRITRSQSRALSEEPTMILDPPPTVDKPLDVEPLRSRHPQSDSTDAQSKASRQITPSPLKKKRTAHARKIVKPPMASIAEPQSPHKTLEQHSESTVFCDSEMVTESAVPKHMTQGAPLLSSPTQTSFMKMEMSDPESDDEDSPPPPPRRKRLIDSLGVNPNQPSPKKNKTPSSPSSSSSSDSDSEESLDGNQLSQVSTTAEIESQNQHWEEMRRQAASQEAALRNMVKPVTGNARGGQRITYARQRSYLAEETDELSMFSQPLPSLSSSISGTRRRLATARLGSEEPESESQGSTIIATKTKMQSIHELRAAGESRRFADEVEELFSDIDASRPISTRRMGYYAFAEKMRDKTFCLKFRSQGFDDTLVSTLTLETDDVICFAMAYIAYCLLTHDPTPRIMLQLLNNEGTQMLLRMLNSTRDISSIARDRKTNMSRMAQESVGELRQTVLQNRDLAISKDSVVSPQLLSLKVLDELVRRARQSANIDDFFPSGALSQLVAIIKPFTALASAPKLFDIPQLELTLSILESYSIGDGTLSYARLPKADIVTIASLFPTLQSWNDPTKLGQILLLTLRLCINIANHSVPVCIALSQPHLITSLVVQIQNGFSDLSTSLEDEQRLLSIDLTVLCLGLLMNFAECSESARNILLKNRIPSSTTSSPSSLSTESSNSNSSPTCIDALTTIFITHLSRVADADSLQESHTNVAFGYLAVMLGELVSRDDHIRYHVRGRLKSGSLKELIEPIEEFIRHHRKVDGMELMGEGEGDEQDQAEREMIMDGVEEMTAAGAVTLKFEGVVRRLKSFV